MIEDSDYGREVDWWGVGVVLYEMITGRLPFHGASYEELFDAILKKDVAFPSSISDPAKVWPYLLVSIVFWSIFASQNIVTGLLEKNPSNRLGGGKRDGRDVMAHPFYAGLSFEALLRRQIKPPFIPIVQVCQC